jgi:hypothetical protein
MNAKIEVIYKNSEGQIVDKKDLPKMPRNRAIYKDKDGYTYKSKKSLSSEVKVIFSEPIKKEDDFKYSEDNFLIKTENEKYSLIFNKKTGIAEISSILPAYFSKGYVKGRTTHLKNISLNLEDVKSIEDDKEMLDVLVETN